MVYTDDDLLDALRAFDAAHHRPPTTTEADDSDTSLAVSATYRSHFDGWSAAIEAADLPERRPWRRFAPVGGFDPDRNPERARRAREAQDNTALKRRIEEEMVVSRPTDGDGGGGDP